MRDLRLWGLTSRPAALKIVPHDVNVTNISADELEGHIGG
jgi:hypothetical protein